MLEGFVAAGHQVIGCGRSEPGVDELRSQFGDRHRFDVVDVGSDSAVRDWAASVLADGAPDLLVNNAALINQNAALWEVSSAEFDSLMQVNVNGVANVIRHFVPAMIEVGTGVIVNFSSGWGRSVAKDVAPYCGSKWAIEGLTRALAADLPDGIAAIPLSPGAVNTDMLQTCMGTSAASFPSPTDWATLAVPFILDLSAADNGQPLTTPQ
jgi:NAD(P)-dependent dehydrogenase (short-subunit alcohol dehydrogenase family)